MYTYRRDANLISNGFTWPYIQQRGYYNNKSLHSREYGIIKCRPRLFSNIEKGSGELGTAVFPKDTYWIECLYVSTESRSLN